jgi:hypothetical protein
MSFCETSFGYRRLLVYNDAAWAGSIERDAFVHCTSTVEFSLMSYLFKILQCSICGGVTRVKGIRMSIESYCMLYTTYKYSSMHIFHHPS